MPNLEIHQVLEQVAELLEGGWTKRAFARDKNGETVNPQSSQAKSFCVAGGVSSICYSLYEWPGNDFTNAASACLEAIRYEAGLSDNYSQLGPWNDVPERTAEEVIAVVRAAAKREAGN